MNMTALRVNGAELAYAEFGTGDTIVVSAQQEFALGGFLEQLAAPPTNYHVFAIRLRRLSKTDEGPGEDRTPRWYQRWSNDVYAATQALGLSDFMYTGVSHGGVIGWHLAVEHPGLLKGLVAIVGVPPFRSRRDGLLSGRASQMAARSSPETLRANMEQLFGPTTDPARLARREAIIESRIQRILATPPEEAAVRLGIGFPDVDSDEELEEMLGQIHIPTLIIGGMYDPWVTPEALLRTARAVPGSKLVVYQDESHLLSTESPAKVIDEFRLFVANLVEQPRNTMATRT
jgi:pimeloyl-ACP methyl ester carboxylesterase